TAEGSARPRLPIYVVALSRRRRRSNDQLTLADTSRRRLSTAQKPAPTAHPSCRLRQTTPWQWCLKRRTYEQLSGARGAESRMDLAPVDRNEAADTSRVLSLESLVSQSSKHHDDGDTSLSEHRSKCDNQHFCLVVDIMRQLAGRRILDGAVNLPTDSRLSGAREGREKEQAGKPSNSARTKYSWLDSAPDTRLRSACCCFFALWLIDATVTPGPPDPSSKGVPPHPADPARAAHVTPLVLVDPSTDRIQEALSGPPVAQRKTDRRTPMSSSPVTAAAVSSCVFLGTFARPQYSGR
ncbi:hypothetical protein THAOC_02841, partial [Thalassiosira oceanica]